MAEAPGEITCQECGKSGKPQPAPVGDARFCPHCGAQIEESFIRFRAPGVRVEITPAGTTSNVDVGELAAGAGTVTGWAFGGLAGLALSLIGALLGGVTDRSSEERGLAAPRRPGALRRVAIAGLVTALVLGFVASPGGSVFLSPVVALFVIMAGYIAFRMRRR